MTIAVHVGKKHSENMLCGMCDSVVGNKENLETHMVRCEIYQCYFDNYKFKTLGDLKEHVKGKHAEWNEHFKCIHATQGRTFYIKLSLKHILCLNFSQNFNKTELNPGPKEESQICLLGVPSGNICI